MERRIARRRVRFGEERRKAFRGPRGVREDCSIVSPNEKDPIHPAPKERMKHSALMIHHGERGSTLVGGGRRNPGVSRESLRVAGYKRRGQCLGSTGGFFKNGRGLGPTNPHQVCLPGFFTGSLDLGGGGQIRTGA